MNAADLHAMSVRTARDRRLGAVLAELTGLSASAVRGRRAHGWMAHGLGLDASLVGPRCGADRGAKSPSVILDHASS